MTTVSYLSFEINNDTVKPGREKTKAVEDFQTFKTVHQVHLNKLF